MVVPCLVTLVVFTLGCASTRLPAVTPIPREIDEPVEVRHLRTPCPDGAQREGTPWPHGFAVRCERDGELHGEYIAWNPDGSIQIHGFYVDGKLHGTRMRRYWSGQVTVEQWDLGTQVGTWRSYYADGAPESTERYADGHRYGPERRWHQNGELASEQYYQDDARVGVWRSWDDKGELQSEWDWSASAGEPGVVSSWRMANGLLYWVSESHNGQQHGISRRYDRISGQLTDVYSYRHGKVLWHYRLGHLRANRSKSKKKP